MVVPRIDIIISTEGGYKKQGTGQTLRTKVYIQESHGGTKRHTGITYEVQTSFSDTP